MSISTIKNTFCSPLFYIVGKRNFSSNRHLVMVILAKNEDDIIEENIRFHSDNGVDAFVVMDNNSTDDTKDILSSLSKEYDLTVIHQKSNNYQQKQWMSQLIFKAKKMGASWVIPNDADEFWIPQKGTNLKKFLKKSDSTITVRRFNVLLDQPHLKKTNSFYKIIEPISYTQEQELYDDEINLMFAKISPKVIVNPHGFIKISGGNHRATHIANPFTARKSQEIEVLHFPLRSWKRFEKNIINRAEILSKNPNARMGNHYKRWARLLKEDKLQKEFEKFFITENKTTKWQKSIEKIDVSSIFSS